MPELGPKNLSFFKALKDNLEKSEGGRLTLPELETLTKDYDEKYVGSGAEVVVVTHKDKPGSQRLVAFNYKDLSAKEAKQIFYLHRFFSTLFPHNFPHFYAAAGKDPKSEDVSVSGTIRHEIKKDGLSSFKQTIKSNIGFSLTRYPFIKVERICHQLGVDIGYDPTEGNFIFGDDGGEYYVDTLTGFNITYWDIDKIIGYMQKNKYSSKDIRIARLSCERLKEMQKEIP